MGQEAHAESYRKESEARMTILQSDPINGWLAVAPQQIRGPLRDEMFATFSQALDCPATATMRRAWLTGRGIGYAVAFGLVTEEALQQARRCPRALRVGDFDSWNYRWNDDEETAWACGLLDGYWQGTSEHADADECALCASRILTDSDDYDECVDGRFCDSDCHRNWHASGSRCQTDLDDAQGGDRWDD